MSVEGGGDLLVALDVGNTQTVVGCYRGDELLGHFRLSTDRERTPDEYGVLLLPLLARIGVVDPEGVDGLVISSVVPPLRPTFDRLGREYFGQGPLFVEPGIRSGLPIRYENPAEVGADRIVNAVAARSLYGTPVVVVDFGTATTFDVVNERGEYVGGMIAPGIAIAAEALFAQASRLYRVDLRRPEEVVGRNTATAMQSGIYWGYIGLVDGLLERLREERGELGRVVATGGNAELIAEGSRHLDEVDPLLTFVGLKIIHDLNR